MAPSLVSSLEAILTPQPFSATVVEMTSSTSDAIKLKPVDGSVNWDNCVQSVDWNRPQAEVSRCPKHVAFYSCPTDVPFHPVSNVQNPASPDSHNSSTDSIVVTVNPISFKSGSNGDFSSTNDDKKRIRQSIKNEQQQCDSKETGEGFDRVLTSDSGLLKNDDKCPPMENDDQCPLTVHDTFHTSNFSSSVSTPNNESLPILAFLSTHLQP